MLGQVLVEAVARQFRRDAGLLCEILGLDGYRSLLTTVILLVQENQLHDPVSFLAGLVELLLELNTFFVDQGHKLRRLHPILFGYGLGEFGY